MSLTPVLYASLAAIAWSLAESQPPQGQAKASNYNRITVSLSGTQLSGSFSFSFTGGDEGIAWDQLNFRSDAAGFRIYAASQITSESYFKVLADNKTFEIQKSGTAMTMSGEGERFTIRPDGSQAVLIDTSEFGSVRATIS